ncbi:NADH:ubiquinone reductase (Na(+)-transporting) subunit C [bacterium]|nr:NADH:ubiquinone reductase (Na(+)-transporting) subunit C [bacterium]
MDVNKNSYTIIFATIMVVAVAALLSSASIGFKPYQSRNVELEKKQNILQSVGLDGTRDQAAIDYPKYIKEELVLNYLGEIQEGSAFDLDLSKELRKEDNNQLLPLYVANVNGMKKYIVPLRGKGLWGPIWGFISLEEDLNTVSAAVFDHKSETPGLGAEINGEKFEMQFLNTEKQSKKIMKDGKFVSISVKKGKSKGDYEVDGISGGTITSDGVTDMIDERLSKYLPYFASISPSMQVSEVLEAVLLDEKNDTVSNINERIID